MTRLVFIHQRSAGSGDGPFRAGERVFEAFRPIPRPAETPGIISEEDSQEVAGTFAPDSRQFCFGSSRPLLGEDGNSPLRAIWIMAKTDSGRGFPVQVAPLMMYVCETAAGDLYYTDLSMGGGIAVNRRDGVKYGSGERLPDMVNYITSPAHPYIAPAEQYLLYDGEESNGYRNIYVSFRKRNGTWTKGVKLGNQVNMEYGEMCPSVSPDGRHLFFESRRSGNGTTPILQGHESFGAAKKQ